MSLCAAIPMWLTSVRKRAEERIAVAGFAGRLVVIADPEQGMSDGKIEWADGGVVRDMAAIGRGIDDAITAYLETHGTAK